ncbi:hypothetical protein BTM25_36740 [Actinomadura rubteroloni]|uniref:Trypsin-like peptidase domain-containing protein n=1 Tax=Actinomadura rubteroloni TaxID=1926885 RepID=A0A2P4UJ01_9ACTN|nr:trypsin-like peptidase domain-containing protein [Actinomadura rubteroloni]POM25033.1 hypothetical protein BTM25_36740 [Actinomadura rubteroloni]
MVDWGWRVRVGDYAGSGFLVAPDRVLTAAHVVAGLDETSVDFPDGPGKLLARVLRPGEWDRPGEPGDVAVLELHEPVAVAPARFVDPGAPPGRRFGTYGFPRRRDETIRFASVLSEPGWGVRGGERWTLKALDDDRIEPGYSGAAVYDAETGAVHGMITDAVGDGARALMMPLTALRRHVEELDDLLPLTWLDAAARRELRTLLAGRAMTEALHAECAAIVGRRLTGDVPTVWAAVREIAEGWPDEDRLGRWVAALARRLDGPARQRLAAWRQRHLAAAPPEREEGTASVIVRLERVTHGNAYELTVHTWLGGREELPAETVKVGEHEVRQAIEERVQRAAGALVGQDWMIEFAVPESWLHKPFEEWHIDRALKIKMRKYPVVVRDVERLRPGSIRRDLAFRRWRRLGERGRSDPQPVGCAARARGEFERWLEVNDDHCVLVYGSRPAKGALTAALNTGVPVMLWPRVPCGGPAHESCAGRDRLAVLLPRVEAEHPNDLPSLAQRLRLEELPARGHELTLLWDDPSRLPDPPLGMEA